MTRFQKELIVSAGVVLGIFLVGGGALYWLSGTVAAQATKITTSQQIIEQRAKSIDILASLKTNSHQVDSYQTYMDQLLPAQEDLINFPKFVDGVSRIDNVGATVAFQGAESGANDVAPGSIAFLIDSTGPVDNLNTFLAQIEDKSPQYIVSFDTVDFTNNNGQYHASVRGRVYFR